MPVLVATCVENLRLISLAHRYLPAFLHRVIKIMQCGLRHDQARAPHESEGLSDDPLANSQMEV